MANIILLDDEVQILEEFSAWVKSMGHNVYICQDIIEALNLVDDFQEQDIEIDLFVFDHNLKDGVTSLDLINQFNEDENLIYQNRFIVATGVATIEVAESYVQYGSMGHLIKPIHQAQFTQTINQVLAKIEYESNQKENWESAYEMLENMGLLESIDELKRSNEEINESYLALKQIYEQLQKDLLVYNKDQAKAYEIASESFNKTNMSFDLIYHYQGYMIYSDIFIKEVREIYGKDRILFFRLLNYLRKISENPNDYRIKKLHANDNIYEYRIGRDYRLYFSKQDNKIVLERFGGKNVQDEILHNLKY